MVCDKSGSRGIPLLIHLTYLFTKFISTVYSCYGRGPSFESLMWLISLLKANLGILESVLLILHVWLKSFLPLQAINCYCLVCKSIDYRLHCCFSCVYFGCYKGHHIQDHAKHKKHYLGELCSRILDLKIFPCLHYKHYSELYLR